MVARSDSGLAMVQALGLLVMAQRPRVEMDLTRDTTASF